MTTALQRAFRRAQAQDEIQGQHQREILAEELEHFADRLRDRLSLEGIANALLKEALWLRTP